jgi:7-cyano-7-deazaguanine reductase
MDLQYNMLKETSPLGKTVPYHSSYNRDLLFPIPRQLQRDKCGIPNALPFKGWDIWNGFEIAWLNSKGKPMLGVAEFYVPCTSSNLVESKSFKLYLNSFHQTTFESLEKVKETLVQDLSEVTESPVEVRLAPLTNTPLSHISCFEGLCLDDLDIECNIYKIHPDFLTTCVTAHGSEIIEEIVYSNLMKSNCPMTNQPDWASIQIHYVGKKINHAGLLKYIVSFRDQQEFHEQCIEHAFMDIMSRCAPKKLTVYARYTRRGGLDINPYRSTEDTFPKNIRLLRQ